MIGYSFCDINKQIDYYDNQAKHCNRVNIRIKLATCICTVLISLASIISLTWQVPFMPLVSTIIAGVITYLNVLHGLKDYDKRYISYRRTWCRLKEQKILFFANAGPYTTVDTTVNQQQYIEICVKILQEEADAWESLTRKN